MTTKKLNFSKISMSPERALAASLEDEGTVFFNFEDNVIYVAGQKFMTPQEASDPIPCTSLAFTQESHDYSNIQEVGDIHTFGVEVGPTNTTDEIYFATLDETVAVVNFYNGTTCMAEGVGVGSTVLIAWCGSQMASIPVNVLA